MSDNRVVLGLNAWHGDSSAALLIDGNLAMAVEEERFNRIKHWAGLPVQAAAACISYTGVQQIAHVAISRDPRAHLLTKLARTAMSPSLWRQAAHRASNGIALTQTMSQLERAGLPGIAGARFHYVEHHRAHMASAFFASPFDDAVVVSVDGFGDFSSVMWGVGRGNRIDVKGGVRFPHSLGLFYTAFTQFLGFPHYGDEYKMMGLSTYGEPSYAARVREVVRIDGDQIRLNLDCFRHHNEGVEMTWAGGEPALGTVYSHAFLEKFGEPRMPGTEITQRHMDIAASAQKVLEEIYFALMNYVQKRTGKKAVTLAGGVALNCVANGMLFENTDFRDIYVQPAANDAGTSIGAALHVWHHYLDKPRNFQMPHVYWGNEYSEDDILNLLDGSGAQYHCLGEDTLVERTAQELANGQVVGWFQGRMEFGPRALGNRSILADPRRKEMKDVLNSRIKKREPFRPFCPSVLAESVGEFFENDYPSPFMTMAYKIKPHQRERLAAVTHLDGTGRLQTVEKDVNPLYWNLIQEFGRITGVPVLLNTSFNENEPIVETPHQALDCFLRTRMDVLVLGPYLLLKSENQTQSVGRRPLAASTIGG
ncbi:MAG TPA: carbamoyltransferase C-terminal domain-containing protein [Bryobacteraceae bacterium]|jgi:carbamoyltransferase|nr:carbamoyltransferase C-terminal domain-containing protein [Bryobacteraceae bacterium]